ncbi:MAG: alanine racemase [Chloroflexi bacterium]|nr:alanine racemase [Chloroflexota bacterium]
MTAPLRVPGAASPARDVEGRGIWRDGLLAGLHPADLASTFGTPLYVYDLDLVAARARMLRARVPARADIAYAVKANPSLAVIAAALSGCTGADVSSAGELEAARRAGVPPTSIVVTGPGKSDRFLGQAVRSGVRAVVVESPGELGRLERIADDAGVVVPVLFRLPAHEGQVFGMSAEDAIEAARRAVASPVLEPLGVHAFGVSAEVDPAVLAAHVERTVEAGRRLSREAGFALRLVDAGGGLGIPYADGDAPLDPAVLGDHLGRLDEALADDPATRDTRVLLEPGRFLVAPAGAYLARVMDVKRLHGRHVAVLDGGINHLLAPALVGRHHRLRLVGSPQPGDRDPVPTDLVGPLCTGLDVLARPDAFPEARPGDLIVALDVGAYGFTQSMPWFLSHEGPAEVGVRGGHAWLLRQRLDPADLVAGQRMPD